MVQMYYILIADIFLSFEMVLTSPLQVALGEFFVPVR